MKYQIYGSASSIDTDIMVFVDKLGTIQENKELIESLHNELQPKFIKEIDIHLAVVENGLVIDVSHGTYDECNNSLYYTYSLHQQEHSNSVESLYERCDTDFMHIKMIRVSRFILSFFSREPELRDKIKSALRGDVVERLKVLKLVEFEKYTNFPKKKEKKKDIYKVVAFQFAQVFGLKNNVEIYTKENAIEYFHLFENYILRKDMENFDLRLLDIMKNHFIKTVELEIPKMKSLTEEFKK